MNPQVTVGRLHGASVVIPPFIIANGPVREVCFKLNPDGSADGGVHDLFVITGRRDAPRDARSLNRLQLASGGRKLKLSDPHAAVGGGFD